MVCKTERWRVSQFAVMVFCGLLALLAGCSTTPVEEPPNWNATNFVSHTEAGLEFKPIPALDETNLWPGMLTNLWVPPKTNSPAPAIVKTNLPTVVRSNTPAATNGVVVKPRPAPVYTWTSLKRWTVDRKIGPPRLLAKSPLVTYAISSDRGVMVLAIGSKEATWNGVSLHLGYPPENVDGEIYIHGVDLQKSVEPFLCGPSPSFGSNRVVVIDPGHGGINAGTLSVGERRPEKEFTLDWARRIRPLLEQEGWQVFLTRTNDVDVALSNRVNMAESRHADLFISLHFNSMAPDTKPVGLATFCLTPMGMPSTLTRGYPDMLFQSFPNNNYDADNVQVAERLQRALLRATSFEDRGVTRARFIGVLRGQHRPAVLIEAGFLSNPREAKRIASPDFRQKLAEAVATALK